MLRRRDIVMFEMIEFDKGDPLRIQHLIKTREIARLIAVGEKVPSDTKKIIEVAAILHNIGIHPSEEKYGDCTGKHQEQLGPIYARALLNKLAFFPDDFVERVCYLIAHHHTYNNIEGIDYQILVEADFIVNAYEDNLYSEKPDVIRNFRKNVFKTKTGIKLLENFFGDILKEAD